MPCQNPDHTHDWPDEGELVIEKCERFCGFCTGAAAHHEWKFPWFLRRHVRTVHAKANSDHPNLTVSEVWNTTVQADSPLKPKKRAAIITDEGSPIKKKKFGSSRDPVRTRRTRRIAVKKEASPSLSPASLSPPSPPSPLAPISPASSFSDIITGSGMQGNWHDDFTLSGPHEFFFTLTAAHSSDSTCYSPGDHMPLNLSNYARAMSYASHPTLTPTSQIPKHASLSGDVRREMPHKSWGDTLAPSPCEMRYEDSELLLATPLEKGQAEAEATARHYAVLDLKLAYRNAIRDLSRQGARAGLTSAEIGIVTADEVDRLMSTDDIDQMLASEMTDSDSDEGGPTNGKGSAVNTGWDTADEADADDEQSGSNAGVNEADGYEDEEDGDDEGKLELHETGGGHGREELDKLQGGEDDDELDDLSSGWEGVEEGELGQDEEGNEGGREDGGNEEEEGKGPIDGYVHILQEEAAGFEDEE